jgi:hypothetical protein
MRPESQHIYSQLLVDVVVLVAVEVVVDVEVVPKLKRGNIFSFQCSSLISKNLFILLVELVELLVVLVVIEAKDILFDYLLSICTK